MNLPQLGRRLRRTHRRSGLLGLCAALALGATAVVPASSQADFDNLLAPASACPGAGDLTLLSGDQTAVMECMIDYARTASGLNALARPAVLTASANIKADDIVRCKDFSHTACGRDANAAFVQAGYITPAMPRLEGENLAAGSGLIDTPSSIMRTWLDNDDHRQTLLDPRWVEQGIAMRTSILLNGLTENLIWVSHFGGGDVVAAGGGAGSGGGTAPGGGAGSGSRTAPGADAGSGAGTAPGGGPIVGATRLKLTVRPAKAKLGRRVTFRFVLKAVTPSGGVPVRDAMIHFAGHRARTSSHGVATIAARVRRVGSFRAVVAVGALHARATVRFTRR